MNQRSRLTWSDVPLPQFGKSLPNGSTFSAHPAPSDSSMVIKRGQKGSRHQRYRLKSLFGAPSTTSEHYP
jgi:hypothetical protein